MLLEKIDEPDQARDNKCFQIYLFFAKNPYGIENILSMKSKKCILAKLLCLPYITICVYLY